LFWIDGAKAAYDFEGASLGASDIHIHPHMMLARRHLGCAARSVTGLCVIESSGHIVGIERFARVDGRLPQFDAAPQARASAAAGKLWCSRKALVVARQEFTTEGMRDGLIIVETAIESIDHLGRQRSQHVF